MDLAWQSVRRWWRISVPAGVLLSVALATVVRLRFQPAYEAEAWLRIEAVNPLHYFSEGNAAVKVIGFQRSQISLIRSSLVLEPVIEHPDVKSLPEFQHTEPSVRTLVRWLEVGAAKDSDLVYVRFRSACAESAAAVVNTVVAEYVRVQNKAHTHRNHRIVELLEPELLKREKELEQLRESVRALAGRLGTDFTSAEAIQHSPAVSQPGLSQLSAQLAGSQAEREVLVASVAACREAMSKPPAGVSDQAEDMVDAELEQSAEFQDLRQRLESLSITLADTVSRSTLGKQDPAALQLERQCRSLQERLNEVQSKERARLTPLVQSRLARRKRSELAEEVARMETKINSREAFERYLTAAIDQLRESRQAEDDTGLPRAELEFARADLVQAQLVYQRLMERIDALKTESRAPSRVSVMAPAKVPSSPTESRLLKNMLVAAGVGFLLPLGLAFLWEFCVQRVTAGSQISRDKTLPLLAEVPLLPSPRPPVTGELPRRLVSQFAMFQDSVHYLCRNILLSDKQSHLRVLAVTSAVSGEGKTTVAIQLAVSVAQYCQESVLLADGDLRNPSIHELLDIPLSPGLAELLAGIGADRTIEAGEIGRRYGDCVRVLPAGIVEKHPHAVLSAGKLDTLLKKLRERYRYIIVDTPPVANVAEALSICKAADGTLLTARRDWSRQSQVRLAYERLVAVGAAPVGVVLNGVSHAQYASRYGSYHAQTVDVGFSGSGQSD